MKKKKILIFGSSGMLGHIVYHYLTKTNKYDIIDVSLSMKVSDSTRIIDVQNIESVENIIKNEKPDIVVNCVGILIKGSQRDPSNAIFINSYFPHRLVKIMREVGGKLIHISTDCVFSGLKGNYSENDIRDADDVYGKSKSLGEIYNNHDLTLRTSIIGPELKTNGEGLFHWFMNQKGVINGYTQAYWGGVTTLELAKAIDSAIEKDTKGLVHVTNGEKLSKYELLCLFKELWVKDSITITPSNGKNVDKSMMRSTVFDFQVSSYKQMLMEQKEWMDEHPILYKQYFQ